jgi:O-antigen/teichoic acid export membrane protein
MAGLSSIKRLGFDTALYGLPSIIGRFLNWLLVPMYVRVLSGTAEFGIYTNIYGWTALLLILLTCGMETGFFRFVNGKDESQPLRVYATAFTFVAILAALFAVLGLSFATPISHALGFGDFPTYIRFMILVVALDALSALPFAFLRYQGKALRFALLRLSGIGLNIALNLFFFIGCPILETQNSPLVAGWYNPAYGVGYVFLANFITSSVTFLLLLPQILPALRFKPDFSRFKRMIRYSFPILLLGIAGIFNQTADKILFPFLFADKLFAAQQLGIYGACFKMAAVMVMFTQAFRYAYEPFIFAQHRQEDSATAYVQTMRYFILAGCFIFLLVTLYIDVWKHFITPDYFSGLSVIPIVLLGELFFGIYFNLSLWYKLTDQTHWGAIFSTGGCLITIAVIIAFAPRYGFMACAWASFTCNFLMMLASFFVGRRRYPIPYDLPSALRAFLFTALTAALAFLPTIFLALPYPILFLYRSTLLLLFLFLLYRTEWKTTL